MLVDGKWTEDWQPVQATDAKGGFVRQTSTFRNWVTPDGAPGPSGKGGFKAEPGRYHERFRMPAHAGPLSTHHGPAFENG